jgi:hypothetical protein
MTGENLSRRVGNLDGLLLAKASHTCNCRDSLFELEEEAVPHPQESSIFHVRRSLSCEMPQEASCCSSAKFQPTCAHCAREDEHLPAQELESKTQWQKACSICRSCFNDKKKPLLCGQKRQREASTLVTTSLVMALEMLGCTCKLFQTSSALLEQQRTQSPALLPHLPLPRVTTCPTMNLLMLSRKTLQTSSFL